jgi:imidazolonepropionase-like amidohydrolase
VPHEVAQQQGELADMLVVDGNPLDDLTVLQEQGKHLLLIMKNGQIFKNVCGSA